MTYFAIFFFVEIFRFKKIQNLKILLIEIKMVNNIIFINIILDS